MEEVVFEGPLEGTSNWMAESWKILNYSGNRKSSMFGASGDMWVRVERQTGDCVCLGDCAPSLPSLTLFPFLPGSRAPSLAALRDMTVSTSAPPQTSLSALKSSGT